MVNIPVGVKHWHGAAPDNWFSHLAVEVPGDETSNEWLEAVDNTVYDTMLKELGKRICASKTLNSPSSKLRDITASVSDLLMKLIENVFAILEIASVFLITTN